ncbi:hypothetical protein F7734_53505 [Scytonema sp. UIC 10036]|uniref:hypothetical protein n=1 Tax=Scytonema sp. UIC 10036 TaxID=2304196 RepID=UPI0012DA4B02|nr:hypothetical protein [Scytonema sp. UIC 10036]MUH00625.1 hypothetical protein [Scytonema sp. UIC 10036]
MLSQPTCKTCPFFNQSTQLPNVGTCSYHQDKVLGSTPICCAGVQAISQPLAA